MPIMGEKKVVEQWRGECEAKVAAMVGRRRCKQGRERHWAVAGAHL